MSTIDITTQLHSIMGHVNRSLSTQGSVGLKLMLKSLYCLIQSSLSCDVGRDGYVPMAVENSKLKFEDTTTLYNMLFEKLRERLSFDLHRTSIDQDVNRASVHGASSDSLEELLLLLRCCVLIVRLHPHDQTLMRKFPDVFLHHMLPLRSTRTGRGSISFTKVASCQSMYSSCSTSVSNDLRAKSCDSCILLLKRILEVILDEMFADRQFRERIAMLCTFSSNDRNQSTCSSIHLESMLDVITAHLILSVSGEKFLETFTQSLIWTKNQTSCSPELSLSAAISLVKHPLTSPPILLRAHLISLVSDVIDISDSHDVCRNIRYMEYLSVFRDSVSMYSEHLSKLLTDFCDSPYKLRRSSRRAVEPHFRSEIYDKFNFMLSSCDSSWRANIGNISAEAISSLETDAITYLKMNMFMFAESSRDEVFSFLSSLITRVISSDADEILYHKIKKMTMQEFCLLASILKLMSCSLLRATCSKKRSSSFEPSLKRKDTSPGCHSLAGMMSCLLEYKLHLPVQVQELIDDALKPRHTAHVDSKMILMHFSGLLSLCKVIGLNFLVKGCLFTIMVYMNMVIFEEGSLEFVRPSSNSHPESHARVSSTVNLTSSAPTSISREDSLSRLEKCNVRQMSSLKLASDFQRTRKLLLRDQTANEEVEATNGEVYLKHFISDPDIISELADFVACKPERNYTAWLRNRAESRLKRNKKLATRQWKRKKKACNSMGKGSRRKVHSKF